MKPFTWRGVFPGQSLRRDALVLMLGASMAGFCHAAGSGQATLEAGLAARDITPQVPIRLAGYAGRKRPADRTDHPLVVQALALRDPAGERFVLVSLDNCEVSGAFMDPVRKELAGRFELPRGAVAVVSSHTHSAPVLEDTLTDMTQVAPEERERIASYSALLRAKLVEVIGAALSDLQPARLEHGTGRANFAMNRRVYRGDKVVFGDNPDGPVDRDVPVLRVTGTNGALRAILFGYACHGTSVRTGDDWYVVSGEYMAYAREHLESVYPGAMAMFLTGMGADSDPSPRGGLLDAKRHGLELAGAVAGVLGRPLHPVQGSFCFAYDELSLPLVKPPAQAQLEQDAASADRHLQARAKRYLNRLNAGQTLPETVKLPAAVLRLGDELTLLLLGGEVVVDYSKRLKRILARDNPWTIGYAYEVPCYIPSARLIKEGGYETESSMIFYGYYGPFRGEIEDLIISKLESMAAGLRKATGAQ